MTTDEAITDLEILLANIPKYIRSYRSIEMGVKALKQYRALQEIRQEIESVCSLFAIDKIDRPSTDKEITAHVRLNMILDYIDEYIKEIEDEDNRLLL